MMALYELLSYVRDCNENCRYDSLGPVNDECRAPFTLKAGETLYAKRFPLQGQPRCYLTFSSSPLR
jgi:hypothetical protein